MRSATGSERRAFRRSALESKCPEAETSDEKDAKAGRNEGGPTSARADTASGSDIPERTEATSRSQTSGHS